VRSRGHWVDDLIQRDPRHLYSSASSAQTTTNRQWTDPVAGRGIKGAARSVICGTPSQRRSPDDSPRDRPMDVLARFKEIKKMVRVMALKNFEMIRDDLAQKHLLDQEPQLWKSAANSHAFIQGRNRVLLRTPGYGGFSLLDLHDYRRKARRVVGRWMRFGTRKVSSRRKFSAGIVRPRCRCCGLPKRTFTSDETFEATADLAHYGAADLPTRSRSGQSRTNTDAKVAAGSCRR